MPPCPACETEIDVDEFDVDRDDELSCPECGTNLRVVAIAPVELDTGPDETLDDVMDEAKEDEDDDESGHDDDEENTPAVDGDDADLDAED